MTDILCVGIFRIKKSMGTFLHLPITPVGLGGKQKKKNISQGVTLNEGSMLCRISKAANPLKSSFDRASRREKLCTSCHAWESRSNVNQLRSLDFYFSKLRNDANQPSSSALDKRTELFNRDGQFIVKKGLEILDKNLEKVNEDGEQNNMSSASEDATNEATLYSVKGTSISRKVNKLQNKMKLDPEGRFKDTYDQTSDLYLIGMLTSINIAVFLFEFASPVRNSEVELFSLPSLYGAKINDLILLGEWWRLVTPMFLHSGILHIALGCWVLATFGPQVCRAYGSFTFLLIYILGGIAGNLTSFLHTPEPTVGGTGPVFAIIGAWLIYQSQSRVVIGNDTYESMFQKAVTATAFSFILSHFGPIDDWTHLGAAFTGIAYGYFTCPTLQMDDASSKTGQDDGIMLVRRFADPCRSLLFFSLFIIVLGFLLFNIEPPLWD